MSAPTQRHVTLGKNMSNRKSVVAVACEQFDGLDGPVSGHFGHTPVFVLAELDGPEIVSTRLVRTPGHGEGGCSMPQFAQQLGANVVVVGGIGGRAASILSAFQIEVVSGVAGNAGEALRAFASGTLATTEGATCTGHGAHDHACSHHHHN